MSAKGEMYKSAKSKMMHEKGEGFKERMMEYGKKKAAPAAKKAVAKKAAPSVKKAAKKAAKPARRGFFGK